jgi:AhpD family alkylhydroperoxidase
MMVNIKTKELIAIGASVSANCQPCVKFHLEKAKKLKIAPEDIQVAFQVGAMVRGGAAGQMLTSVLKATQNRTVAKTYIYRWEIIE